MLKNLFKTLSKNKHILLILLGTVVWSLTMVKSGIVYKYGMGFWGPNGHDGVWHVALSQSIKRGSNQMPGFAGEALKNYHIGYDLLLSLLSKITAIPIVNLYFQILPPIMAFLIGLLTYKLVYLWQKDKDKAFWSVFFVYFAGNFGWIVSLVKEGKLGGESMFWSQQSISTLINPPFALSLVLILLGLISLLKLETKKEKYLLAIPIITFGILIFVKVYAGLLVLTSLFAVFVYRKIFRKQFKRIILSDKNLIKVFLGSLTISFILFYHNLKSGSSLVTFKPFWFLETMMAYTDRLGWTKFYSAMTNYFLGENYVKGVLAYSVAFIIFYYGNLGTRVILEAGTFKWGIKKNLDFFKMFFIFMIVAGTAVPMFFIQKGTPWNTIQFFYYSLFSASILAGISLSEILEKFKGSKNFIYFLLVILTIPTTIATLKHYLPSRPPSKLSSEELNALTFLKTQEDGVVLTYPFERNSATSAITPPPKPLYLYESTAYVSAFSNKQVFLEDEVNLDITGFNWQKREGDVLDYFKNPKEHGDFLKKNGISYIYLVDGQVLSNLQSVSKLFANKEVTIYKVE